MVSETLKDEIKCSKTLAGFFCSIATSLLLFITVLSNPSLDIWTIFAIFKKVIPAGFVFWYLGYLTGKLLDSGTVKIIKQKKITEKKAYEIPSIFSVTDDKTGESIEENANEV